MSLTQDEKWLAKYNEVRSFIETYKRNLSRYNPEERYKYCNWIKHNKKLLNSGDLTEERVTPFKEILAQMGEYKRVNQYL